MENKTLFVVCIVTCGIILLIFKQLENTRPTTLHHSHTETLFDEQSDFAYNVSRLLSFIYEHDYQCSLGEAWRSPEQAAIYAKEGKGIRDSLHCERLAIDLNLFNSDGIYLRDRKDYELVGTYWESLHSQNEWGGNWHPTKKHPRQTVDMDHFEMKFIAQ